MTLENRDFVDSNESKLEYAYKNMPIDDIINNTEGFEKGNIIPAIVSFNNKLEEFSNIDPQKQKLLEGPINDIVNSGLKQKLGNDINNINDLSNFFTQLDFKDNVDIQSIINSKKDIINIKQNEASKIAEDYNLGSYSLKGGLKGVFQKFWD